MSLAPRPLIAVRPYEADPFKASLDAALARVVEARRHMRSIYDALAEHLRAAIVSGEIPSGMKLPTERALAHRYGLARVTVRAALARLQAEGLISRRTRVGTVVMARPFPATADQELARAET